MGAFSDLLSDVAGAFGGGMGAGIQRRTEEEVGYQEQERGFKRLRPLREMKRAEEQEVKLAEEQRLRAQERADIGEAGTELSSLMGWPTTATQKPLPTGVAGPLEEPVTAPFKPKTKAGLETGKAMALQQTKPVKPAGGRFVATDLNMALAATNPAWIPGTPPTPEHTAQAYNYLLGEANQVPSPTAPGGIQQRPAGVPPPSGGVPPVGGIAQRREQTKPIPPTVQTSIKFGEELLRRMDRIKLSDADKYLGKWAGATGGVRQGKLNQLLGGTLMDPEEVAFRQEIQNVTEAFARAKEGAVLPEPMLMRLERMTPNLNMPPDVFKDAFIRFKEELMAALDTVKGLAVTPKGQVGERQPARPSITRYDAQGRRVK